MNVDLFIITVVFTNGIKHKIIVPLVLECWVLNEIIILRGLLRIILTTFMNFNKLRLDNIIYHRVNVFNLIHMVLYNFCSFSEALLVNTINL